jgi:hypothetical protein
VPRDQVDVDEVEELTAACEVTQMPTFQFYRCWACEHAAHSARMMRRIGAEKDPQQAACA